MNVVILHDWLNQLGGAEDVLVELHRMFPDAPILTSIYDRERMPAAWAGWDIRSSWMDRLPGIHRRHQPYMPVFALAWSLRRSPAADVVLSNKSGFCIGAGTGGTPHVCYCLAPSRFIFDFDSYAEREAIPRLALPALRAMNSVLRHWERQAAQRVTRFIAISREIQDRIARYYGRESIVIHPPVDVEKYRQGAPAAQGDYFLIVSRLLPYKRIDLAIEAFNRLGLPLVIAGAGRDAQRLHSLAGPTVRLLGRVSDGELAGLLKGCRAFVFPGLEDFGIAPIHAMACGKPVIAYSGGGSLDTVADGRSGLLFKELTAGSLADAVRRLDEVAFDPDLIREHAERFSVPRFERELRAVLEDVTAQQAPSV